MIFCNLSVAAEQHKIIELLHGRFLRLDMWVTHMPKKPANGSRLRAASLRAPAIPQEARMLTFCT